VTEEEAQLTLDVLLKRSMRRPLPRTSRPSGLLLVTLLPVSGSRGMKTTKIKPVLAAIPVVVGVLVAVRTTSITAEIEAVLMLGKMSRG
jgi:hypothetical protein